MSDYQREWYQRDLKGNRKKRGEVAIEEIPDNALCDEDGNPLT